MGAWRRWPLVAAAVACFAYAAEASGPVELRAGIFTMGAMLVGAWLYSSGQDHDGDEN